MKTALNEWLLKTHFLEAFLFACTPLIPNVKNNFAFFGHVKSPIGIRTVGIDCKLWQGAVVLQQQCLCVFKADL